MAREIKFRAWDERRGRMFSAEILEPDVFITTLGKAVFPLEHGCDGVEMKEDVGIALMQYTGLRDRNGTEIYEGDICTGGTLWATGGFHIDNDIATTVTFVDGMFRLGKISLMSYARHCAVIGNIYENADLLTGEPHDH